MRKIKRNILVKVSYFFPVISFLYLVANGISGKVVFPIIRGNEALVLSGIAVWIACLSTVFWFASEFVALDPMLGEPTRGRKILAYLIGILAIATFLYAAIYE